MLYMIYKELTNSRIDPPRYGQHWDDIGFQGEIILSVSVCSGCLITCTGAFVLNLYLVLKENILQD